MLVCSICAALTLPFSSPLKASLACAAPPGDDEVSQPAPSQTAHRTAAVEQQQPEARSRPVQEQHRDGQHVVDEIQRELELQYQRQQQEVVSAAMQAMGALPPNAVFKVPAAAPPLLASFSFCAF